jgi:polyphosphate kinase
MPRPISERPRAPRARAAEDLVRRLKPRDFINREMSWLEFNQRVLAEGLNPANPLLERLGFLSIVSSNLDEFFMVRVGGLKQLVREGVERRCPAGMTPKEQLALISRRVRRMVEEQYRCLNRDLLPALTKREIVRLKPEALDRSDLAVAERYFRDELFPALTPISLEDLSRGPRISGLTMHLAVRLKRAGARGKKPKVLLGAVPLPRSWARFFQLPAESGYRYLIFEDLVRHFVERLYQGFQVLEAAAFRITRDADLEVGDEDAGDILGAMEGVLRARKLAGPVRLELEAHASEELTSMLVETFGIDAREDLFRITGPLDLKPFMRLAAPVDAGELRYPEFEPQPVAAFDGAESIWDVVREKDVLVHFPYESFGPVVELVREAADDPNVMAIKQTLYRTSPESPIIASLEQAALAGKQVTVVVELKARFDEARNIAWAKRLTEVGAQVIYGVVGLKTHGKILLVVRREAEGTRRYVHLSTGNYNDVTARRYEDLALFTANPDFGADASNFFNAVTGHSEPRDWRALAVAPAGIRERLGDLIEREIERSSAAQPGLIQLKMNSLADPRMIEGLYHASRRGVRVRLCVRGICCLRPGIKGLSDHIEVISLVDRFLEHSRIYYFRNGGDEEVYLSSADFMGRNLDRRLEFLFPVREEASRKRAVGILQTVFADNQRAWRLRPDGSYERIKSAPGEEPLRAQIAFMQDARAAGEAATLRRLSTFRPLGPGMAPGLK